MATNMSEPSQVSRFSKGKEKKLYENAVYAFKRYGY